MRQLETEATFKLKPERLFALLHTPSEIRGWWSAARAIVVPASGGLWSAAWGENEDDPDYVTVARIASFEPPHRLVLTDLQYHARSGPLPFEAQIAAKFIVEPFPGGARLRVVQTGFPDDAVADDFLAACREGWRSTLENMRRHVDRRLGEAGEAGDSQAASA